MNDSAKQFLKVFGQVLFVLFLVALVGLGLLVGMCGKR